VAVGGVFASVLRISGSATFGDDVDALERSSLDLASASPICAPALTSSSPLSASTIGRAA
jgi:hypothetical protein